MTFFITDTQRLISEAGGEAPPGMKLKNYFWRLCEDLVLYFDFDIQIRKLERAWREDWLSERLREALEKLALKRAYDAQFKLVTDFETMLKGVEADTSTTKVEHLVVAQIRSDLCAIRRCMVRRYRNSAVARCYALLESAERDAESTSA